MLPLRQEQLTSSLALPQVPTLTQSNRIRFCIWGGECFLCICFGALEEHPWSSLFFCQFISQEKKGAAFRMGWCLGSRVDVENNTGGRKIVIWEGDSFLSATMRCVSRSWNHIPGSALIKLAGIKLYYEAGKLHKASHATCWDCSIVCLIFC